MEDLITVIINVYNGEKFIVKCLDSIINQSYRNLEILVINDGSTDNTLKLCEKYQDKRIRIINQENTGLSKARNVGIENANGKYLYFIDSDDFVECDVIEYLYNLCKKYNTKMSTCMALTIYDYNYNVPNKKERVDIFTSYEMLKKVLLSKEYTVVTWNKLYEKELFDNIRFENRIINDKAVTHKLVIEAEKIAFSNQIKYFYLKHKNAITVKDDVTLKNYDRTIDVYNVSIERYNYVKKLYPNFLENDIGLIRAILKVYLTENKDAQEFFKEQRIYKKFKDLFNFKIFITNIGIKEKVKILLFLIHPKLYKVFAKKYRSIKYEYKM